MIVPRHHFNIKNQNKVLSKLIDLALVSRFGLIQKKKLKKQAQKISNN